MTRPMTDRTPTEAKLLPCPFCGGKADPRGWLDGSGKRGPECVGCGATAPFVEDWNRRAAPPDPATEPFGTYQERDDGTKEFRRTGEPHSPCACGYTYWTLYTTPIDAAAIRAVADESADRQWCEGAKTAVSTLDPLVIGVDMWPQSAQAKYRAALEKIDRLIATRRRAIIESRRERRGLGDKGEAEPKEEPVVVFRPQRGSLAEAMRDRVAFYSIEAFKRHVLNEWPLCGSITIKPYGGIDERIGWDTHLVSVDGMAVGFTDRAIPDPAADPAWLPEAEAPVGVWCRTRRDGEAGENVCRLHVSPDGDREWIEHATGRTTVTHHSFAAPTHVTPLSGHMT